MNVPFHLSLIFVALSLVAGCGEPEAGIRFLRSENYTFSRAERAAISRIFNATAIEVRKLLPGLPLQLELTVRPGTDVVEEFGAGADAMPPNAVMWTVDPAHGAGVVAIARQELGATLFHEFHHLVRSAAGHPGTLIERAVFEGMATAFERDFAADARPWGEHPPERWEAELLALPDSASTREWMFTHPDGRRWIGYRVGTAWVDRAIAKSGRSSADLVSVSAADILRLAAVTR